MTVAFYLEREQDYVPNRLDQEKTEKRETEKGKIEAGFETETHRLIKAAQDSNNQVSESISTTKQELWIL